MIDWHFIVREVGLKDESDIYRTSIYWLNILLVLKGKVFKRKIGWFSTKKKHKLQTYIA